jgi:hypothetical protein
MPTQDTSELKTNILSVLKQRGPSLPVHIAKETGLSILFSSAFLSELLSERKIKISNMRVGSSPIYYIPGQENKLESFSKHLGSKEREAFELLQNKKTLKDSEQHPAIRVALRSIKDFAIGTNKDGQIFWKYYLVAENPEQKKIEPKIIEKSKVEIKVEEKPKVEIKPEPKIIEEPKKEIKTEEPIVEEISKQSIVKVGTTPTQEKLETKELGIFDKPKKKAKKPAAKNNEKFFNKVKDFLSQNNIEILDIESFNKNELILKVRENEQEVLMVAYNKKRIAEEDIVRAHKKIADSNMNYKILSLGEPLKKVDDFIQAIKHLKGIKKIKDNL